MKRIFLGFLLNVGLAGGVAASDLTASGGDQGNTPQARSLLNPHLQYLQKENLTARQMIDQTAKLLDEIFARETQIFYNFMAERDIAPSSIPDQLTAKKTTLLLGDQSKRENTPVRTITFGNLGDNAADQLWLTCQRLEFDDKDYYSLLLSATKRAVLTQLMLEQYQGFHLNTAMLREMGLLHDIITRIKDTANDAQSRIEQHLMAGHDEQGMKTPGADKGAKYSRVDINPELALITTSANQAVDFQNLEWVSLCDSHRHSRGLLIHSLGKKYLPGYNQDDIFNGALWPTNMIVGEIRKSLPDTMKLTGGLLNNTIQKVFLDNEGHLIQGDAVIDRFIYLLETYYLFKEASFCRFARLHGKKVTEAPKDFFSRRLFISANLADGQHAPIELDGLDKELLRSELATAGITKAEALEMMKNIVYHLAYEAILRPGYKIHPDIDRTRYNAGQVNSLFECYGRMGKNAALEAAKVFNIILGNHFTFWNAISESAKVDQGNLNHYTLGFHTGFDAKDLVESNFNTDDLSWGRIAFMYKMDQLAYVNDGLGGYEMGRLLKAELPERKAPTQKELDAIKKASAPQPMASAPQPMVYTGNSRLDAMRERLKKKAVALQNKPTVVKTEAAAKPVVVSKPPKEQEETKKETSTQQAAVESKTVEKKKKKKKVQSAKIAAVQEVKVVEQVKPVEEAAPVLVVQPTIDELQAELGTLKAKEQHLIDELATTKAWNAGLQEELKDKQDKIASLESELEDTKSHKQKMVDRLKKVREKAESDLLAKDALINVTALEKKQAEEALRAQFEHVTQELESLKASSARDLKDVQEKSAAALKAAQDKGEKDFQGALYRIRLVKQETKKAEDAQKAAEQKVSISEKGRQEAEQKLAAAEAELISLRAQLVAKPVEQVLAVTAVEEMDSLRQQVAQLQETNIAFQDTLARGNETFFIEMGARQLAIDTAHAEIRRLQELLDKAGVSGNSVMPTSKLEVDLALYQKANENLKEELENNKLLIRMLKQQLGQTSDHSQSE